MKILQIVTQLEEGGAQHAARMLQEGFRAEGHDSRLVFLYRKRDALAGTEFTTLLSRPARAADYALIAWRLFLLLRRGRPDAVIAHTHYSIFMALPLARLCGIEKRIAVHHSPLDHYPRPARALDRWMGASAISTAEVVVSRTVLRSIERRRPAACAAKFARVENGVRVAGPRAAGKEKCAGPRFTLGHVGRLAKEKNQQLLIDLLALDDRFDLLLVGDGPLRGELEQYARARGVGGRVEFCGEVPHDELGRLFARMDLFVFPSLFESMGLALIEAMQAGVPVVAADIPALRDVLTLEDGTCAGLLVSSAAPSEYHAAVKALLDDPSRRAELARKALLRSGHYSEKRMVQGYLDVLSSRREPRALESASTA